ncbi:MAG: SGNH/GDSL hydrolase family protein, partial [Methylococcales bacterium]
LPIYDDLGNIKHYSTFASSSEKSKESFRFIINNSALIFYIMKKYKYLILQTVERVKSVLKAAQKSNDVVIKKRTSKKDIPESEHIKRIAYVLSVIKGPVVCLYIPHPSITYDEENLTKRVNNIVRKSALAVGVDFIDLSDAFSEDFKLNKQLINGFSNSKPGKGHLNAYGHKLVAKELYKHLTRLGYLK